MDTEPIGRRQRDEEESALQGVDRQTGLAYWRQKLSGPLPVLDLPIDRPRPPVHTYRGATHRVVLTRALTEQLRTLSRQEGCTLYVTLLAAFKTLLYRYSNQTDLLVGTPVAVLRSDLSGNPGFRQLLGRVRETVVAAQAHGDMPLAQLLEVLRPEQELSGSPLFQVEFAFPNATMAQADLALSLQETANGLVGEIAYNAELFDATTIERMAGHFRNLLTAAVASPDQPIAALGLLSDDERHQLVTEWNATAVEYPLTPLIHERVAARAFETPDAVAVVSGTERLTYAELDRRANQLAHSLRRMGLGPEKLVGVCIERSPEMLVALLGALKAGAAYIPIDPAYPRERIAHMLEAPEVGVLLTQERLRPHMPETGAPVLCIDTGWATVAAESEEAPEQLAAADHLAYVIYTSGSTGRPKGVMIEHKSLLNLVLWYQATCGLKAGDRATQTAGVAFDAAIVEIWPALAAGATLYLPDEETRLTPTRMRDWLVANQITVGFLATPLAEQVVPLDWPAHTALRFLLTGGEKLKIYPPAGVPFQLIDAYGPAESTVVTTLAFVPAAAGQKAAPSIGRPIANTRVYLLDGELQPVPVGVRGELYIGSSGLARGYLNRPDLTAERFITTPMGRLYKTGDLARWRPDGSLEFAGRSDDQVKIRGFRIELGEIEAVLKLADGVAVAVAVAREDQPGHKRLVAYVVPEAGRQIAVDPLRAFLRQQLPDYMVPAAFVTLAELPLTPNGKVDRRALPAPEWSAATEYVAPRTPQEEALAEVWREVLGVSRVGIHDSFFELGGHSLLATRITTRIRTLFGVDLPVRSLFAAPTVAGLATLVAEARGQDQPIPPLTALPREGPLPLSFAQQRLWFLDQLQPGSAFYNIPQAWRVTGRLDLPRLERSLTELAARHEALRTTFSSRDGEPVQVISPDARVPFALTDLADLAPADREAELQQVLSREAARPFDLAEGPLLRALVVRLAPEEHVLMLNIHHIVADGWSMAVVMTELSARYAGSPLAPLPVQYADYAVWQRAWLEGGETERQLAYWKERMAGAPAILELPTDRPRPAVQTFRGALLPVALPSGLAARLAALSRQEGATLFMTLLAAFQTLLARYSGQTDIVVGSPVAGRNRAELEPLIGFFVNTLPHRTDLSGDPTFRELLARVREGALGAFGHQDLPFQHLVEELQPERSQSHNPLFQVAFALQNAPGGTANLPGLTFTPFTVDSGTAKFDLTLFLQEAEAGLVGEIEYNTDLFDRTTIERLAGHLQNLLAAAVENPDLPIASLHLLSDDERRLMTGWNETVSEYPVTPLIHERVAARAFETPDAVAVVSGTERLTYAELDRRANQLAHYLRRMGVGPEQLVGVCMERSPALLVALLGALKAGAAYLPIDPAYPRERIAYMLEDAQVGALLTQERLLPNLPEQGAPVICLDSGWAAVACESEEAPPQPASSDHLAYVIYTSGSTGRPKGVMIEHKALLNLVCWHQRAFGLTPGDRTTQTAGVAFDAAVWEIWPTLAAGATLYLPDEETRLTPARLRDWLVENRITVSFLATPLAEQMLTLDWPAHTALRILLTGGDKLHNYPPAGLPFRLVNCYGPTESTVVATAGVVPARAGQQAAPSIGRPIANTRAYLLDGLLNQVPVGVTGELYIGSSSLARGYLNRPDLTAERFITTPMGRLYRTGDLARYLPDGAIEFVGRSDNQVKIRGFRIELGEIETMLKLADAVAVAVVIAREDLPGGKQLVAYVVPEAGRPVTPESLRAFLGQQLPDYMIPAAFVIMAELPLTPNGKVDRRALPAPELDAAAERYVAPRTPLEEILAGIWSDLLGVSRVGIHDSFFELGGHSLLATRLTARMRAVFDVDLPVRSLFAAPTVAELTALVAEARREGQEQQIPPIAAVPRAGALPLSFPQQRLWFLDRLEPGSPFYNIPAAWRVAGRLELPVLEQSLAEVLQRHEALRTTFAASQGGEPVQVIHPSAALPIALTDLTDLPPADREAELQRVLSREAASPFNLAEGPLLRAVLVRLALDEHVLMLNVHHIVADGWSMGVLLNELSALYAAFAEGQASPLAPLPVQYADYAVWQRAWLDGDTTERQLAYWKERMAGAPAILELPTDRPRPAVQTFRGALLQVALPAGLAARLGALSRQEGATPFMALLAGFEALLARYTGQTDIVVGLPVAGRTRPETEGLIGFFVNTLLHRTDLSDDPSFRELLARVREGALSGFSHQDLPFQRLVEELQPERSLSHSPLFQVMFTFQNAPAATQSLPGLTLTPVTVDSGVAKLDLTLSLEEGPDGFTGMVEYNTDLFDRTTIERMMGHYLTLLDAAAADPDRPVATLPLMQAAEQRLICEEWSQTGPGGDPGRTVVAMLSEQARRTPAATALICGEQRFPYAELDQRANRLAQYLQQQGVGPEVLVGICLDRTPALVTAVLAVVKAGGAYVPLDPNYPPDRLSYMIEDSRAHLVIDAEWLNHHAEAIAACPDCPPAGEPDPENLMYVIYTSGSTGRPKGVAVTHRSVAVLMDWVREQYSPAELSGVLFSTSVCFDISIFELFGTLCLGGTVILAENALQLPVLPAANEVRLINTVPSAGAELVRQRAIPPSVITVNLAGEALPRSLVRDLYATGTVKKVVNLYGPTEDTVYSTWAVVDRESEQQPPIGRPLPGTRALILDRYLQPVSTGVAGELCLAGRGLARGYLHRPELTAERFITTESGERIYRTGDLVRWLPDGQIEYLGRIDHQVKIRGFRIELGEVQEALLTHPAVGEAVVVARQESPGDLRLVAYFSADAELAVPDLRAHLRQRLPDYMLPSAFVQLPELPHLPNGKVDRKALPAPEREQPLSAVAPRTPAEARLAALWCGVLRLDQVGVEDDFFLLGGHSLLAAQLIARIRTEFGVELPLRAIFANPTVAALAAAIAESAPLERSEVGAALLPLEGPAPLSFAQRRLWFLEQFEPGSSVNNLPIPLRLTGALDVGALAESLQTIVQRHDALRTTFGAGEGGEPVQVVACALDMPLPLTDLSDRPDPESEALEMVGAEASRPFDLGAGPLIRAALLRLGPADHILLITMHHIVSDLWSKGVLFHELAELHRAHAEGRPAALPPLAMQYSDYARWQRQWLQGARLEQQVDYWKRRMAGAPTALDLPTDRPRPAVKTYRGAYCRIRLSPDLAGSLRQLSRQEGATLYMTLMAAFQVLLHRYSGQADISVGTPVAGRTRQELEALIGFFISTLVIRTDLSGNPSFRELLARVRENILSDFAHQDLPFETLVEALQPVRDTSRTPLFQVMFSLQNAPMGPVALPGLTVRPVEIESDTAKFDLTLAMEEGPDGLHGVMEYNTDLFDRTTIERMLGHFRTLLEGIAADAQTPVAELPLLTAAERQLIVHEWNDTAVAYRQGVCLHELIEEQVEKTPEADALVFAGERLSYRELNRRANQLAHRLRGLGVGPDVMVGICMERSLEMVVGLVGILKAGGAYVPLDPAYPQDRLAFMLADAEVPVLLTQERLIPKLPEHQAQVICLDSTWTAIAGESDANPATVADPENTAYVIFTSGSTGRPKGVMVPHKGIVNRLLWMQEEYQLTAADRVMQKTPFSFDVSVWEFFWPLMTGATMVVAQPEGHKDSQYLIKLIRDEQVTTMHFVPSMLQVFAEEPELGACASLRQVMCSGEALPPDLVERFYERAPKHVLLHNLYGPTEASVDVTYWACPREGKVESVPIGRPVANTQMYVLNAQLQPAPVGVAGELHIGGVQLAKGYLKRPDLTNEKFIPNPFGAGKLYKTGDLARYRADGAIEYLGRIDHQVKIRGFRIELGEIEAALSRHGGVQETVVVAREDVPGQKQLVAYVVPAAEPVTAAELREFLKAGLPEYMVPAQFVMLEAMPLSPNGKLDRKALPAPERAAPAADRIPPRTVRELQLLPVWESVLGVSPIGVADNFFELGGHSIMAVRLLNAVREATGRQLPIASLFQGPTIARQAELLEQQAGDLPWSPLVPIRATGARPPFFCVHGGFGSVFCFADLARELGPDQPFYGLQPRGLYDDQPPLTTIPAMAARYIEAIREVQPHGPYFVGGYCMGGLIAQEMARQLAEAGEDVPLAVMLDTKLLTPGSLSTGPDEESFLYAMTMPPDEAAAAAFRERWESQTSDERWAAAFRQTEQAGGILPPGITDLEGFRRWFRVYRASVGAHAAHDVHQLAPGELVQFLAMEKWDPDPLLGWQKCAARMEFRDVPGDHATILEPPHVRELAAQLRDCLTRAMHSES